MSRPRPGTARIARVISGLALSVGFLGSAAAPVRAEPQWLAWQDFDASGVATPHLAFGTVATDTILFDAACKPSAPTQSEYALYVDIADHGEGDQVSVMFTTRRDEEKRAATIVEDAFGLHVAGVLPRDDALWEILAGAEEIQVNAEDGTVTTLHLRGSRVAITHYLSLCDALPPAPAGLVAVPPPMADETSAADSAAPDEGASGTGAGDDDEPASTDPSEGDTAADSDDQPAAPGNETTDDADRPPDSAALASITSEAARTAIENTPGALPGALFTAGAAPVPAYSSFRYGIILTPIAPGTEVMSMNRTGHSEGKDWVEVATERGAGRIVWVIRSMLTATGGGASEYLNINPAANLLLRAEPNPDADVVGTVPALATGIRDQGMREGDWVQVAFRGTVGWAAHDFLLPILPPPPEDSDRPVGAPGNQTPYTADFAGWTVDCDPCRNPLEGAACRIFTQSNATVRAPADLRLDGTAISTEPRLVLRYFAGPDLPAPAGDTAVLTMSIDGAPPHPIARVNWQVEHHSGAVVMPEGAFASLMPSLKAGQTLTLTVTEPGRNWADQFALTGFAQGLFAMTARLPVVSHYGDEDMCPTPEPEDDAADDADDSDAADDGGQSGDAAAGQDGNDGG